MSLVDELDELHTSYAALSGHENEESSMADVAMDATPHSVLVHSHEERESRWSHVKDLDSFFKNVYVYHQKHGFWAMLIEECLELLQFAFIVLLTLSVSQCVDYELLFSSKTAKISLMDVFVSPSQCLAHFSISTWVLVSVAVVFWATRMIATFFNILHFWDIKAFFNVALHIQDHELDSFTWHDVQQRLVEAQSEHQMSIEKTRLTELDIHHRILRFDNYMVAMVNKGLLPVHFDLPIIGQTVFFSRGLRFNLELIFFKGHSLVFDMWHLKDDFKKAQKKKELVVQLDRRIMWLAFVNLILMPFILIWQILYTFYNYVELIQRVPGTLGLRKWSSYSRLYLRHFNELDHELKSRLSKAYRPAKKYMEIFVSPITVIICQALQFMAGSVFALLFVLTIWDEDTLSVEHVLLVMTICGGIVTVCRSVIPDENLVFAPETSLAAVVAHIHYFPDEDWRGNAHTSKIMDKLGMLFPYTFASLLQELFSPIVTPVILYFSLRSNLPAIVDFFRNFTVSVAGVGDVCSFAQMDVRLHGHPDWQKPMRSSKDSSSSSDQDESVVARTNGYTCAKDGKTEMSLVHFALTNPEWKPISKDQDNFIHNLQKTTSLDIDHVANDLGQIGGDSNACSSIATNREGRAASLIESIMQDDSNLRNRSSAMMASSSLAYSTATNQQTISSMVLRPPPNLQRDLGRLGLLELTETEMSLSALYLHEMHHRSVSSAAPIRSNRGNRGSNSNSGPQKRRASSLHQLNEMEETPLLAHSDDDNSLV